MSEHEIPSEDELFNGRMADGSRPPMPSGELYQHWEREIPGGDEDKSPAEIERDRLHYDIDKQHLARLDKCCRFAEAMVEVGLNALHNPGSYAREDVPAPDENQNTEDAAPATGHGPEAHATTHGQDGRATSGRRPYTMNKQYRTVGQLPGPEAGQGGDKIKVPEDPAEHDEREVAGFERDVKDLVEMLANATACAEPSNSSLRPARKGGENEPNGEENTIPALPGGAERRGGQAHATPLRLDQAILIGERGSKLLMNASAKRTEIAHKLVDLALKLDTRKSFMQDRAIAVIYATLLHLDKSFSEIGFGSWMPFRFPDQWLSFCGVMTRVLAAKRAASFEARGRLPPAAG